jgi:hydrogenase maturation factor
MRVVAIDDERCLALCADADGARHTVELALVDAEAGDQVLVHAGVALVTL